LCSKKRKEKWPKEQIINELPEIITKFLNYSVMELVGVFFFDKLHPEKFI